MCVLMLYNALKSMCAAVLNQLTCNCNWNTKIMLTEKSDSVNVANLI